MNMQQWLEVKQKLKVLIANMNILLRQMNCKKANVVTKVSDTLVCKRFVTWSGTIQAIS